MELIILSIVGLTPMKLLKEIIKFLYLIKSLFLISGGKPAVIKY